MDGTDASVPERFSQLPNGKIMQKGGKICQGQQRATDRMGRKTPGRK